MADVIAALNSPTVICQSCGRNGGLFTVARCDEHGVVLVWYVRHVESKPATRDQRQRRELLVDVRTCILATQYDEQLAGWIGLAFAANSAPPKEG